MNRLQPRIPTASALGVCQIDASSNGCSGWLNVDNTDIFVNGHFFRWASRFETEDDAAKAGRERVELICKRIEHIWNSMTEKDRRDYDKEKQKGMYAFHVVKMESDPC